MTILPRCRHPARGPVGLHPRCLAQLQLRRPRPDHLHHPHRAACLVHRFPPTAQGHLRDLRPFQRTAMKERSQSTTEITIQISPPRCRTRTRSRLTGGSRASRTPFQLRRPRKHPLRCRHPSPRLPPRELCLLHLLCRASPRQTAGRTRDGLTLDDRLMLLEQRPRHLRLQTSHRKTKTTTILITTRPLQRLRVFQLRHPSLSRRRRRLPVRTTTTMNLLTSHNPSRGLLLVPQAAGLPRPLLAAR